MPLHSSPRGFRWTLAILTLSTACFSYAAAPTPVKANPISGPVPANLVHTMQKPNGSRVKVSYRVDAGAVANQPVTITLIFDGVTDDSATVHFTADPELHLSGTPALVSLPKGSSQTALQVTPSSDGLFYVNVFTAQAGATSVISVPVQQGSAKPKLQQLGKPKPAVNGERIISMPVP